ncbi:MAG: 6-carboxytetrahydropterin synthase, partial [Methylocystaceae bacterium]
MDIVEKNTNSGETELTMNLRLMSFLNASHYAVFNGKVGQTHSHSWQLQFEVEVPVNGTALIRFEDLEKIINGALKPYQRVTLNEMAPFDKFQPFTENIAAHFFNFLHELLAARGSRLTKLVVWENPTKGVEITQILPYGLLAGQVTDIPVTHVVAIPEYVDTPVPSLELAVDDQAMVESAASEDTQEAADSTIVKLQPLVDIDEPDPEVILQILSNEPKKKSYWWVLA